jgi:phosphotransferase system IIB component
MIGPRPGGDFLLQKKDPTEAGFEKRGGRGLVDKAAQIQVVGGISTVAAIKSNIVDKPNPV